MTLRNVRAITGRPQHTDWTITKELYIAACLQNHVVTERRNPHSCTVQTHRTQGGQEIHRLFIYAIAA